MGAHASRARVHVRLDGFDGGGWGIVPLARGDTVGDVAARACGLFVRSWGVDETRVSLFLVSAGGDEEPSEAAVARATSRLGSGKRLASVGVSSGAWLVARASPPCGGAGSEGDVAAVDYGDGGGRGDDAQSAASPLSVSEAVGPIFENEARAALATVFHLVCPWLSSHSSLVTRFEMSFMDDDER